MKLVRGEAETSELREALAEWQHRLTSTIGDFEVRRAAGRSGVDPGWVLAGVVLVEFDERVRRLAATVGSPLLRSLDAIHLATALSLGDDLGGFCCYDRRLAADAEAAGLTVVSPGLD